VCLLSERCGELFEDLGALEPGSGVERRGDGILHTIRGMFFWEGVYEGDTGHVVSERREQISVSNHGIHLYLSWIGLFSCVRLCINS